MDSKKTTEPIITLELTSALVEHLARLLNAAKFSGGVAELKQILATHDELIAAFNEAVAMPTKGGA